MGAHLVLVVAGTTVAVNSQFTTPSLDQRLSELNTSPWHSKDSFR